MSDVHVSHHVYGAIHGGVRRDVLFGRKLDVVPKEAEAEEDERARNTIQQFKRLGIWTYI